MCLRFLFLLTMRLAAGLRLSQREETWKTAEILILRHQLVILHRLQPRRPKLTWADRALLAALPGVIPKRAATGCGCWSPQTRSCAGAATSPAAAGPPGPCPASPARPDPPEHQGTGPAAGPREPRMEVSQDPRRAGGPGSAGGGVDGMADSEEGRDRPRAAPVRGLPGRSSCALGPRRSWRATSSRPTRSTAPRPTYWPSSSTRPGASASSQSRSIAPGRGPPSRHATSSWTSASRRTGSSPSRAGWLVASWG